MAKTVVILCIYGDFMTRTIVFFITLRCFMARAIVLYNLYNIEVFYDENHSYFIHLW
jgi:hypothetical protein